MNFIGSLPLPWMLEMMRGRAREILPVDQEAATND